ncbi:MAG: hypothetical protein Q6359_10900, partial [Candidatus Brocadiales bacterium]|nr:hypothetical protein [Candidatus Brocadiales bacterium]
MNKPVLVTNFGEYRRFFGNLLGEGTYGSRRWLPYAVEGFFANGGRRTYIVRVAKIRPAPGEPANTPVAAVAHAILPDRSTAARRTLAQAARAGESEIDLPYWAGLSVGDVLQLGDGVEAEYVQITGFTDRIRINTPLARDHRAGVTVMQVSPALTTLARPSANSVNAPSIHVANRNAAGLVVDAWVQIEEGNNTEFVRLGAGGIEVTPTLRFTHEAGRNVRVVGLPIAATGALGALANIGDTTIQLNATAAAGLAQDDWIQILGNSGQEQSQADFVRIVSAIPAAAPFDVTIAPALRFAHAATREIRKATIAAA